MLDGFGIPLAAALTVFAAAEIVLSRRRAARLQTAQNFLRLAKQETLETAQLSLRNPYPLIQISAEGKVIFLNPAAFEKFPGIREKGLQHPVLSGLEIFLTKNEIATREVSYGDLVYNQMITPTQVSGAPAFIIYCYDITQRKEYEKSLKESRAVAEKARQEAEKANQARGEFLANMSHELRTPMNGIIGLSDILIEAGLKSEHREMIEAVNSSAHNLLILLNDILDFSKIEAGELSLESIPFDPRKIIRQIEALQKPVAARKGLEMVSKIDDAVPARLTGDPSRLQQVLNNLINNALKFTERGSVTLSLGGKEDGQGNFITQISVTDTGIGIPADKQAKVFEKFQQADSSTSRKYGGTGLGLTITKNLSELMGGSISLTSAEGKGTTFTVTIPAKIAAVDSAEENEASGSSAGINTKARLLIADDHPVNLLFMRQALTKLGFTHFDEASSGRRAIELFKQSPYDLILMDCKMPEMDGYEATRHIRTLGSAKKRPIIIAVTADAMKSAIDKCMQAGMDDYISKPVDKEKLRAVLQRWIPGSIEAEPVKKEEKKAEKPKESEPVFDWDHLNEFTDGDKETETMLITMFLENLDLDLQNLQQSFHDNDFTEWEAMAHKLCGSSSHMGAFALADICDQAQSLSAAEAGRMKELHQLILNESRRLHSLLETRRAAA